MAKRKRARTHRKPKATTEQIVGAGARTKTQVRTRWRKHYEKLVQLRDRFLNRQSDLAKDALEEQPTFSTHMADAGTDTYDRDLALGMLSSEQDAVYEIDQALKRIRDGSYGICELTGKRIEADRLLAIPWTRFSADAEKELEKSGEFKKARLGEREAIPRTENAKTPEETT